MQSLFKEELLALLKNKKILIPVLAVLFIPILYSGMFLWAFWDPYGQLSDLPVVVTNQDKGAIFEGEELELGNELVDRLKKSDDFNFKFMEKEKAYESLENQQYYLLIEIPENFSENATTLLDYKPKKLELKYVPNESYNFLASQIGGTAIQQMKAGIAEKVSETYAETMFTKIEELAGGIGQASDGAEKLSQGSLELKDGTETLHEKLSELASKSIEFNNGVKTVQSGTADLAAGMESLANGLRQLEEGHQELSLASRNAAEGSGDLVQGITETRLGMEKAANKLPDVISGTTELRQGAESLAGSLQSWQTQAGKVSEGVSMLEEKLQIILSEMPNESQERMELEAALSSIKTGTSELSGYAGELSQGASELSSGLESLNQGQIELQSGINTLAEGSAKLENGAKQAADGQQQIAAGMNTFHEKLSVAAAGASDIVQGSMKLTGGLDQLSDGTNKIVKGTGQLEEGSGQLVKGTAEIHDGNSELAEKLSQGSSEASSINADENTFNMMANPVEVKSEKLNEVPNYGTGFAPYFISLGLFVGALMISIVFPLREPAVVPRSGVQWFLSKFAILGGIGIIQGLIAAFVLMAALGLEVQSVPLFLLFSIVTSLTFMALIQFLVSAFGDPGRFVAILVLIFQLTTSAGTFPLELIPNFLQPFSAFLPMTYTVQGFKAVISSGNLAFMWQNVLILVGFAFIFMIGSLAYFNFKHKRQFRALLHD